MKEEPQATTRTTDPGAPPLAADLTARAPDEPATTSPRRRRSAWHELPVLIVVALILAVLIKSFLVQAFYIPSASMVPTLEHGDRVLVNRLVYRLHPPRRGDIIVFSDPHPSPDAQRSLPSAAWHWLTQGLGLGSSDQTDYIKRVIGLPGETVEIQHGIVFVDGRMLAEPYLSPELETGSFGPFHIPDGDLFVMGDNRMHSADSRFTRDEGGLGFVPVDKVIGRAFTIVWPPGHWRWLSGISYD